jgi:hypothetical protein
MHEDMTLIEAAAFLNEFVLGNWQFGLGRKNEELLPSVSGVSLTWRASDDNAQWTFVFSLRRNDKWHKIEGNVAVPAIKEGDGECDQWLETRALVQELGFWLLREMMTSVFPDAEPELDDEE